MKEVFKFFRDWMAWVGVWTLLKTILPPPVFQVVSALTLAICILGIVVLVVVLAIMYAQKVWREWF